VSNAIFKVMGGYALAVAVFSPFVIIVQIRRYPHPSAWEIARLAAFVLASAVAGIGLFRLKKWAALTISAIGLWAAVWTLGDTLRQISHPAPGDAPWVGFLIAGLFIVPSVVTGVYWRDLAWRGRQGQT
jgi:hypothetical protein